MGRHVLKTILEEMSSFHRIVDVSRKRKRKKKESEEDIYEICEVRRELPISGCSRPVLTKRTHALNLQLKQLRLLSQDSSVASLFL